MLAWLTRIAFLRPYLPAALSRHLASMPRREPVDPQPCLDISTACQGVSPSTYHLTCCQEAYLLSLTRNIIPFSTSFFVLKDALYLLGRLFNVCPLLSRFPFGVLVLWLLIRDILSNKRNIDYRYFLENIPSISIPGRSASRRSRQLILKILIRPQNDQRKRRQRPRLLRKPLTNSPVLNS